MTGQVARILDEEHQSTLSLLAAAEGAIARTRGDAARDDTLLRALHRLHEHLVDHVPRHFGFEEDAIFPRLAEAGEGDLCELLTEEHRTIEAVIADFVPLAADVGTLDAARMDKLRRAVLELCERLRAHIDKETMALVPACSDRLDPDADRELTLAYTAS